MSKSFIRELVNSIHPIPWVVEDLPIKQYYGTKILDLNKNEVATFWLDGDPSSRYIDLFGAEVCDNHYESDKTLAFCEYLVDLVNRDMADE